LDLLGLFKMDYRIKKFGSDEYLSIKLNTNDNLYYEINLGLKDLYIQIYLFKYIDLYQWGTLQKIIWGNFIGNKIIWGEDGELKLGNDKIKVENIIHKIHKLTCFI